MNRTLKWWAVLMCAVSMTPVLGAAQSRIRTRTVVPDAPGLAPLVNLYWQQESRTRLGIYLNTNQSRRYDRDGALITGVMRDSPAEEAGLEDDDIITVFDGQVLTVPLPDDDLEQDFDLDESLPAQRLLAMARELEVGQTVEIRYLRDGASNTVSVEADEFEYPEVRTFGDAQGLFWRDGRDRNARILRENRVELEERLQGLGERLEDVRLHDMSIAIPGFSGGFGVTSVGGVQFIDLNPQLGEYFGVESGVLVTEVDEDSTLGLVAGDVVVAVGARDAETVERVRRLIRSYDEDEPIRFRIMRQGSEMVAEGVRE